VEYVFKVKVHAEEAQDAVVAKFDKAMDDFDADDVEFELTEVNPESWEEAGRPMTCPECNSSDVAIHPAASPSFVCRECDHVLG